MRIEQSKGLKDRLICLSDATLEALKTYLAVRGPVSTEHVFIDRHVPLGSKYCQIRLRTYGKRCGVSITPRWCADLDRADDPRSSTRRYNAGLCAPV